MKWICYDDQNTPRVGRVSGEFVYPVENIEGDVTSILEATDSIQEGNPVALKSLSLHPPVLRPPKIICVGLNYHDHAEEQNKPIPESPLLFLKAPNCVIGAKDSIIHPGPPHLIDYEVELGVVIGKAGSARSQKEAEDFIFGYTIFLDITARDCQKSDGQWFRAKSFKSFGPMGPLVWETQEAHPQIDLELSVNGELRQKSNTKNLIFDIPSLIFYISNIIPLEKGDIISTGTPGGVGVFRNPKVFLKPGDKISASIQNLGTLEIAVSSKEEL